MQRRARKFSASSEIVYLLEMGPKCCRAFEVRELLVCCHEEWTAPKLQVKPEWRMSLQSWLPCRRYRERLELATLFWVAAETETTERVERGMVKLGSRLKLSWCSMSSYFLRKGNGNSHQKDKQTREYENFTVIRFSANIWVVRENQILRIQSLTADGLNGSFLFS